MSIKALPVLQNPISKTVYTDEHLPEKDDCKSGINTLSFYTEFNDEQNAYYAIGKEELKKYEDNYIIIGCTVCHKESANYKNV